jgi:hypothetical protein
MVYSDEYPANSPYSRACWTRFRQARHAGPPPQAAGWARGSARGRSEDTEILFWLCPDPLDARFQAHGSPWAIAAAELLCECWLAGQAIPDAHAMQRLLSAPPDRLDAFFTVEDAWQAARTALDTDTGEVG